MSHQPPAPQPSSTGEPSFLPPPSRLVLHPVPALILSLPLTQRIHALLLTSRQLETLSRHMISDHGYGYGYGQGLSQAEIERQIEGLEKRHAALIDGIMEELEGAWVGVRWLSKSIDNAESADTSSSSRTKGKKGKVNKRAAQSHKDEDDHSRKKRKLSLKIEEENKRTSVLERGESPETPPSAIGIMQAMIPLTGNEKERMKGWSWTVACKRGGGGGGEECFSPFGRTVFWV